MIKVFVRFHLSPQSMHSSRSSHLGRICVVDSLNAAAGTKREGEINEKVTQCEFLMRHSKIFTSARNGTKNSSRDHLSFSVLLSPPYGSLMVTGSPLAFFS